MPRSYFDLWSYKPPPTLDDRLYQLFQLIQNAIAWFVDLRYIGTAISMAVSVLWVWYAWGWTFLHALGLTTLLLIHEMGHVLVMYYYGVPATTPLFILGFAAFVKPDEEPTHAVQEAFISLGGPFIGGIVALCCYALYTLTSNDYCYGLAYIGCLLNLINLLPASPLDGSHVVTAIWRGFLFVGLAVTICVGWFTESPFFFLMMVLTTFQIHRQIRKVHDHIWLFVTVILVALGFYWENVFMSVPVFFSVSLGIARRIERQREEADPSPTESQDLWQVRNFRYGREEALARIALRKQQAQYFVIPTHTCVLIAVLYFGLAISLAAMLCDMTIGFTTIENTIGRWLEFVSTY